MDELFPITTFKKVGADLFLELQFVEDGTDIFCTTFPVRIYPCLDNLLIFLMDSFCLFLEYRIHLTLGLASSWWWQKTKEEELHYPKENQTQAQEGQVVSLKILQS